MASKLPGAANSMERLEQLITSMLQHILDTKLELQTIRRAVKERQFKTYSEDQDYNC